MAKSAARRERIRIYQNAYNKALFAGVRLRNVVPVPRAGFSVPSDVMAERNHRINLPPQPFGDPPPGYSALDRRAVKAPSIVHDPLDDLVFGLTG